MARWGNPRGCALIEEILNNHNLSELAEDEQGSHAI